MLGILLRLRKEKNRSNFISQTIKYRAARTLGFGLILGVTSLILLVSGITWSLEEDSGLGFLFAARGAASAPTDIAIVSVDKFSADRLEISAAKPWPRRLHACLVEHLTALGATLIVFDIFFRDLPIESQEVVLPPELNQRCPGVIAGLAHGLGDDDLLAKTLALHSRVLLLQQVVEETLDLSEANNIMIHQLLNPARPLRDHSLGLAPFPLPVDNANLIKFYPTIEFMERSVPTLPLLAALTIQSLPPLEKNKICNSLLIKNKQPCSLEYPSEPEWSKVDPSARDYSIVNAPERQKTMYLNYFGPAGTLCTRSYVQVMGLEQLGVSPGCRGDTSFRGKTVFVGAGWSPIAMTNQADDFDIAFFNGFGSRISGVEVLATAFANLRVGSAIKPASPVLAFGLVCLVSTIAGILILWLPNFHGLVAVILMGVAYGYFTQQAFQQEAQFYPILTPLGILLPVAIFLGLLLKYLFLRQAIRRYVPSCVVEEVSKTGAPMNTVREMEAVCLCSDVADYTALAETLSPHALTILTNDYFQALTHCLFLHQGELFDIVGDGMTCLWPINHNEKKARLSACLAALDMLREVEEFNQRHQQQKFNTRLGLHWGRIAIGEVGGEGRFEYSVVGDTVNTASRIEGLNKSLNTRLLASESVVRGLDELLVRPVGRFRFKGKSEILIIAEILGLKTAVSDNDFLKCLHFAKALAAYDKGDWAAAEQLFRTLIECWPMDGPSTYYRLRCSALIRDAIPHEESTAIVLTDK